MSNTQEKKEETKSSETEPTTTTSTTTTANPPPAAEAIEEDDEFEEFDPCRWDAHDEEAEDAQQWQVCVLYIACVLVLLSLLQSMLWIVE